MCHKIFSFVFWKVTWFQNDSFFNSSEDMICEIMTWKNEECILLSDVFEFITETAYVFFMRAFFICVDCYHLLYLTIRIHKTILIMIFFLITIKTFIFCETSFLFIWFSRSILCMNSINIHEIVCKNRQIQKCENNRLRISLSIWLSILLSLIETEIFINSLTQSSKFSKNWQHVFIYQLILNFIEYCSSQSSDFHVFVSVQFTHQC